MEDEGDFPALLRNGCFQRQLLSLCVWHANRNTLKPEIKERGERTKKGGGWAVAAQVPANGGTSVEGKARKLVTRLRCGKCADLQ